MNDIKDLKFRCSKIGRLMVGNIGLSDSEENKYNKLTTKQAEGKELTKIQAEDLKKILLKIDNPELPKGAKTAVEEIVEEWYYNYKEEIDSRQIQKGNICENNSIYFYNECFFKDFKKNTTHFFNEFITGTPDVFDEEEVIDFKTSWNKKTFPKTKAKAYDSIYEWQLRGYMWLLNLDKAKLVYCLVNTPEELCEYEADSLHNMEDLDDKQRFTILEFERDTKKEEEIIKRVHMAKEYALEYLIEIKNSRPEI